MFIKPITFAKVTEDDVLETIRAAERACEAAWDRRMDVEPMAGALLPADA